MKALSAKMIEAEIGDNAVDPRIKRALESKPRQFDISAQESFLVNILTILRRTGEANRHAENRSVILMNKLLEGCGIALLRSPNQLRVVNTSKAVFAWEHMVQTANAIHVTIHATRSVGLRQHVFPVSSCPSIRFVIAKAVQHHQRDVVLAM